MSFRSFLRILLSFAVLVTAGASLAHGSPLSNIKPTASVQTTAAPRVSETSCPSSAQQQCHMLAVAAERVTLAHGNGLAFARLPVGDDPERARLALPLERKPPRSSR